MELLSRPSSAVVGACAARTSQHGPICSPSLTYPPIATRSATGLGRCHSRTRRRSIKAFLLPPLLRLTQMHPSIWVTLFVRFDGIQNAFLLPLRVVLDRR